jgi:cytochrome bd ubiquinol oxidase subunit I
MGRQPWVIQDLMPTMAAVSKLDANAVITTFILFAIIFTALLIAELSIMFRTIKTGPKPLMAEEAVMKEHLAEVEESDKH